MDNVVPGIYVLMENRQQNTYDNVFSSLRAALPEGQRNGPSRFSVDFELAAANAFKETFPHAREAFCFFHFAQSLWRKLQQTGHSDEYLQEENSELREQFHAFISLCFVPPEDVIETFLLAQQNCLDQLDEVAAHLENTYILGRRRGRGRQRPRYPLES